jgi:hypothetical protein
VAFTEYGKQDDVPGWKMAPLLAVTLIEQLQYDEVGRISNADT